MKTNATNQNQTPLNLDNQILSNKLPDADFIQNIGQIKMQLNSERPFVLVDMPLFKQKGLELIQMAKRYNVALVFMKEQAIKANKSPSTQQKTCIKIRLESGIQLIEPDQIIHLQAQSNYTIFYLKNILKPMVVSKPLKFYANQFNSQQFIRPHRSYLVNKQYIKAYCNENGHHLILKNDQKIAIARRRLKYILTIL